jgi:hypothetical protein
MLLTTQQWRDPDVWWHLSLGRMILASGIPATEPFSFLTPHPAWVGQQWGYEVVLAAVTDHLGRVAMSLLMGVAGAGAILAAAWATRRDQITGPVSRSLAIVLSALVAAQLLGVRGQVITVLGTALTLVLLNRWRDGGNRTIWLMVPLLLVWANLHAGFFTGVVLALAVSAAVAILPGGRGAGDQRALLGATAVATLATVLNPSGFQLWHYVAGTFLNSTLTQQIVEWSSPDFHGWLLRVFEAQVLLLVALWVASRRVDPVDVALAIGAFVASLSAQRNVALFAVVAAPQIAHHGSQVWALHGRRLRPMPALMPVLAALVVAGAALMVTLQNVTPEAAQAQERSGEPQAAATFVAQHLAGQRIYSIYYWGGYLAYRFPTQRVVYIYGESAVFGNARLAQAQDIHQVLPLWHQRFDQLNARVAVLPDEDQNVTTLTGIGWSVACHDVAAHAVVMTPAASAPGAATDC